MAKFHSNLKYLQQQCDHLTTQLHELARTKRIKTRELAPVENTVFSRTLEQVCPSSPPLLFPLSSRSLRLSISLSSIPFTPQVSFSSPLVVVSLSLYFYLPVFSYPSSFSPSCAIVLLFQRRERFKAGKMAQQLAAARIQGLVRGRQVCSRPLLLCVFPLFRAF